MLRGSFDSPTRGVKDLGLIGYIYIYIYIYTYIYIYNLIYPKPL